MRKNNFLLTIDAKNQGYSQRFFEVTLKEKPRYSRGLRFLMLRM